MFCYYYDGYDFQIDAEEKILDLCKKVDDPTSLNKIEQIYKNAYQNHFILFVGKKYEDEPYKTACRNKHYQALEWLLSTICKNIKHQVQRIYCHCALSFEIDSAQWLMEKYPFFETNLTVNWLHSTAIEKFHQYQDSIEVWQERDYKKFRIRRKEETKWYHRKHALMLAKNKNCILYHLPNEILRYMIQSFL
jgi:hypothetical protein